MKRVYLIGGPMGVGKTAVCQELKLKLNNCVFLDGDWCWDAHPFQVTEETKQMVMENVCFLLNQFIHCSAYDNIIFCWVMHEQSIIDTILDNLDSTNCEIKAISLTCDERELRERLSKDIAAGKREPDVIDRSLARLPLYHWLNTVKIGTNGKTASEIAEEIARL
ncbi:MAG TPA: AAA family ATPase [Bacillota bacterium]|jgi:broad-specificity NMP kinase|nr:AAA family ATPase [Bacillota bacterium]